MRCTLRAADFFVLRTPVLPFDPSNGGEGARDQDLVARRVHERAVLAALLSRADVKEAIAIASPSLLARATKKGESVETALVRYVQRMSSRPTPFGLFATVSIGAMGENATRLS